MSIDRIGVAGRLLTGQRVTRLTSQDELDRLFFDAEHYITGEEYCLNEQLQFFDCRTRERGITNRKPITVLGSSQPSFGLLKFFITKFKVLRIIDLRGEPHGFVRMIEDNPVLEDPTLTPFDYSTRKRLFPGFDVETLLTQERQVMYTLEVGSSYNFMHLSNIEYTNRKKRYTIIRPARTEEAIVQGISRRMKTSTSYARVLIHRGLPPDPPQVDRLVGFYQETLERGENMLIHCLGGQNRTATALVLTDIMDGKDVKEALDNEAQGHRPEGTFLTGSGVDLRTTEHTDPFLIRAAQIRLAIIYKFHDYWHSKFRQETRSFSDYMAERPIDHRYLSRKM